MSWRRTGGLTVGHGVVSKEYDEESKLYRVTLAEGVSDVSDNPHEAMCRLAERLELIARALRK